MATPSPPGSVHALAGFFRRAGGQVERLDDPLPAGRPVALQVELTSECQLRCRMCPLTTGQSSTSMSPGPMRPAVFEEVLRLARACGRVILAGYGEPLTNPQCLPMLRALDAAGVTIAMSTNGIALSPAVAAELAALDHLELINVSIDSPDPATYRAVRSGSVTRAMRGLANLMDAVDDPARVRVSAVAMSTNLTSLVELPGIVASLGVRRLELQAVMDYTAYAATHRLLEHRELALHLDEIERRCTEHGVELELCVPERLHDDVADPQAARAAYYGTRQWDDSRTRLCHVPWEIPFVDKDGTVFPCCFAASQNDSRMGTLATSSFEDIWSGPAFRRFRAALVDGRSTPEICRRCTVAPLGRHLFRTWAATVESVDVRLASWSSACVRVTVRNTGEHSWTPESRLCVGTSGPRDTTASPLRHAGWPAPNRAARLLGTVPPGGTATVAFDVASPRLREASGCFELVAEGTCWVPNTLFSVVLRNRRGFQPLATVAAQARAALGR